LGSQGVYVGEHRRFDQGVGLALSKRKLEQKIPKRYEPKPIERPERVEDRAPLSKQDFEKQYKKMETLKQIYG
jgi:hypothetical protein